MTAEQLHEKLAAGVEDIEFLTVQDTSDGCGAKFAVVIVSKKFNGMTAVERHQSILGNEGVLAEEMKTVCANWCGVPDHPHLSSFVVLTTSCSSTFC